MRIVGASDTGWVPIDLSQVARAIATLRVTAAVQRERPSATPTARSGLPRP